jgi:hypothetical protein
MSNLIKLLDRVEPILSFEVYLSNTSDEISTLNVYKAEDLSEREYLQWIKSRSDLLEINRQHKEIKTKYVPEFPEIPEGLNEQEQLDWLEIDFNNTLANMENPPEIPADITLPQHKYSYLLRWVDEKTPKDIVESIVKFEQSSISAARRWVEILCKLKEDALIDLPNKTIMIIFKEIQSKIQELMVQEVEDNLTQMATDDPKL